MAAQQKSDSKQSKMSSPKRQAAKPAPVASMPEQSALEMQQAMVDLGMGWPTVTALNCCISGGKVGATTNSVRKACPIIAGSSFNLLTQWDGLQPDENGFVHVSIADFSF
jgi:hypothetical protein